MKKSVIFVLLLISHFTVNAETQPGKQIEEAKFQIVKATIEFLASDKETFKEVKEPACKSCRNYEELLAYTSRNKLKKADILIGKWKGFKVDTTYADWNESLIKFKDLVINDISSGPKSKRKQLAGFPSYTAGLDSIIREVSISESEVSSAQKTPDISEATDSSATNDEVIESPESAPEQNSYFNFLPKISKDMNYIIIFLLLAIIAFLTWMFSNKNKALEKKARALQDKLVKNENSEWQSKTISSELKTVTQKLKDAEKQIVALQEDLKAEKERNKRLSAVPKKEKPAAQIPVPAPSSAPAIKYARYADQGDGFSVQELLDEEDSETIFELTLLSASSASFKISNNPNAQRFALSNSPYFLGKTSQYETFPSGNSLINTDVPGELKLQGNKWQIVKPVQISFS
jgi:hypothetical protein